MAWLRERALLKQQYPIGESLRCFLASRKQCFEGCIAVLSGSISTVIISTVMAKI